MKVAIVPWVEGNPYQALLYKELEKMGVATVRKETVGLRDVGRLSAEGIDLVHLHWIEYLAGVNRPSMLRGLASASRFVAILAALRARGMRVVWTVHNLAPHESFRPRWDSFLFGLVARASAGLIVHTRFARDQVRERWGPRPVAVAPHGNFRDAYPIGGVNRETARTALGLPRDAFVFLCFGQVRGYKRLGDAIAAFRSLPEPHLRLVLAGKPVSEALASELSRAAEGDARILLRLGQIPDAEVSALHLAADAAVIPYAQVFSSGALLLALSFALPAVVPIAGSATEVAPGDATEPFREGSLAAAMARMASGDIAARRATASAAADVADWETTATAVLAEYQRVLAGGRSG